MKKSMILVIALVMAFLSTGAVSASAANASTADDSIITETVRRAILQEARLRDSHLWVSARGGVVQLAGVVEKTLDVEAAAILAGKVPGVVEVKKELVVVKQ